MKKRPYLEWVIDELDKTFFADDAKFSKYLYANAQVTEWLIVSDYCLYDKHKPNNSLAFTIMPYPLLALELRNIINVIAPKDIKDVSRINEEYIDLLKMKEFYHVCILMKENSIISNKQDVVTNIDEIIRQYKEWIISTPHSAKAYDERLKRLRALKQTTNKNTFSYKKFTGCFFLSFFVGYLSSIIHSHTNAKKIAWASDRDDMTIAYNKFTFDQAFMNYHCMCEYRKIRHRNKAQFYLWTQKNEELWFDELIRIADYIAGTFADYDTGENRTTHDKFISIIEKIGAGNERFELREIGFGKEIFHHKILDIQPKNK